MATTKYIHTERVHNLDAPSIVVPLLMKLFHPDSVVDIGCGTGNFLKVFKEEGIPVVKGYDGAWVNRDLLKKNGIENNEFEEADFERFKDAPQKYDLALCLEVAEHLKPEAADQFIRALTTYSDVIVFSAAIPSQGGQNHLNEQWPSYWGAIFEQQGFRMYDIVRSMVWNNSGVNYWYKQNAFVYIKHDSTLFSNQFEAVDTATYKNIIHPDIYLYKAQLLERILEGRYTFKGYMKMLLKYFRNHFRKVS
ncbi:MAG TPA: class I SAM-dependent methyltransferase [Lacibacter sp.]|nr:class I SAM-dependent methyltransferase [Lacibacter sp.]